jgi:hypothetical protein
MDLNGKLLARVCKHALIARLGLEEGGEALFDPHVSEFDITGRPTKGWVLVEPQGVEAGDELSGWVQRAVKFVGKLPAK